MNKMNLKNVEYTSYNSYLESLIKSLSNFCSKCPLKPTIKVVKELGVIYVYYKDNEIKIDVNVNENKKKVIGDLKKILESEYPIIYKKSVRIPTADEVKELLNRGETLEEALNATQTVYEPIYKIERIHDKYNEFDLLSIKENEVYKFKSKIPIMAILEDLKHLGRDSDAISNITCLYKINSEITK